MQEPKNALSDISKAAKCNANEGGWLRFLHNRVEALVESDAPLKVQWKISLTWLFKQ